MTDTQTILALDVGDQRVGLALASQAARLPAPLATLNRDDTFWHELEQVIQSKAVSTLVVGLPRNLAGQSTAQTAATEAFVAELKQHVELPVDVQDEAVTSKQAEAELQARGKPYRRGDVDALAATYILQDWLNEHVSREATT